MFVLHSKTLVVDTFDTCFVYKYFIAYTWNGLPLATRHGHHVYGAMARYWCTFTAPHNAHLWLKCESGPFHATDNSAAAATTTTAVVTSVADSQCTNFKSIIYVNASINWMGAYGMRFCALWFCYIYIFFSTFASFKCLLEISKSVGLRDNERMINACVKLTLFNLNRERINLIFICDQYVSYSMMMTFIRYYTHLILLESRP